MAQPYAPRHLSERSKQIWRKILPGIEVTPAVLPLLEEALSALDRIQETRELVKREGLMVGGEPHPALRLEKEGQLVFLRCWRQLGLGKVSEIPGGFEPAHDSDRFFGDRGVRR